MTNITIPSDADPRGNRSQGWLQSDKDAHKMMWQLGLKHPSALAVLHFMISKMSRGANGIIISAPALARQVGLSERTVKAAVAVLRESQFVQVLKTGNTNAYIINSKVAWQGARGLRYASFNAQILVDEQEQQETVESLQEAADQQIDVPIMQMMERPENLDQPFDAELVEPKEKKKRRRSDQMDLLEGK